MRSRILFAIAIIATVAGVGTLRVGAQPDTGLRWEYRVLSKDEILGAGNKDLAAGLNRLGDQGWELAAVDGAYIFKRLRSWRTVQIAALKAQLQLAEAELEMRRERTAWSERMQRKGFLSETRLEGERAALANAELTLEQARKALESVLLPEPKKAK
jgi:hypothetical protein